ncbi:nuclear transport factor 2 family protein [Azospirillum rugosum]|uniref:Ketosteroid isomerase-like protein n=1 Tax=Azospirillum rugosum TaxID=416170 RepID=A0ABS4SPM6_9PROT|nr:nuclear transport factor 2 family protein [Azospirillum rugosum]MBP2294509.1 ketosteroid isomerase-like protein [Azospirillum rugosum]MDQ0529014.1 ketosteroid isomerase-like protein [Azospirillum rugosum]
MLKNGISTKAFRARRALLAGSAAALALPAVAAPLASALAQQDEAGAVAKAVEALRAAMLAGDGAALKAMTMEELTYGHSNSRLEDKAAFVASLDGKNAFKSIDLSDHAIQVVGDTAIARHTFDAVNNLPDGKTSTAHIKVLQVWKKDGGAWKLLARQAAPLPA